MAQLQLTARAADLLPVIRERLVREFKPLRIVVFGSQARGDADEMSDIDLLVVMPDDADVESLEGDMYNLLADLAISKDIVVSTPSAIETYGSLIGSVLRPALREGITVYVR